MPPEDRAIAYDAERRRPRRLAPPVDEAGLLAIARDYVGRFWGPSANLRRVLLRHADRSVRDHASDPAALRAAIEAIVARMVEAGAVDDRRFAALKAASLAERGASQRLVAQRLRQTGVSGDDVAAALGELQRDGGDQRAADRLVARRRLGYLRPEAERRARRDKDLAVLLRGGFDLEVARRALAGPAEQRGDG